MKEKTTLVRVRLEKMRGDLLCEIEDTGDTLSRDSYKRDINPASVFGCVAEAASAATSLQKMLAIDHQKRNKLACIEHALQKINQGTYGICDCCESSIEAGRLEVLPHAAVCTKCAGLKAKSTPKHH
jgi:DnaK suppressor protein